MTTIIYILIRVGSPVPVRAARARTVVPPAPRQTFLPPRQSLVPSLLVLNSILQADALKHYSQVLEFCQQIFFHQVKICID